MQGNFSNKVIVQRTGRSSRSERRRGHTRSGFNFENTRLDDISLSAQAIVLQAPGDVNKTVS
jgi:hypothetical protein